MRYGNVPAIRGLELHVGEGETVAVLGANGAGKTTLLRTLAGLKSADRGRIVFDGDEITRRAAHWRARNGIVLVPEGRHVFPRMTVLENLQLGAWGASGANRKRREVIDLFPLLTERLNEIAGVLSGGEQQMLAVARALMKDPRILLLDEPSMGLSPAMCDRVFALLREISGRGISILLIEQNARRSLDMAQRAYVLQNGRIVLAGPAEDLRDSQDVLSAYFGRRGEHRGGAPSSQRESRKRSDGDITVNA